MPVSQEYLDYLVDQMRPLGQVTAKRMFGGAGLYHKGAFFGLVADDVLYFKADEENRKDYLDAGSRPFKPFGTYAMGYYEVPAEVVEDPDEIVRWARKAIAASRKKILKKTSSAGDGKKRLRKGGKKPPKKT